MTTPQGSPLDPNTYQHFEAGQLADAERANHHPLGAPLDLDAILNEIDVAPRPVQLAGHTYQVRRDLTGTEIADYWRLVNAQQDLDALAILVGPDDAARLNMELERLPQPRMSTVIQKIMEVAGLVTMKGTEGESRAS